MDILQAGLSTHTDSAENFDDVLTTDWFNDYARLSNQKCFMVEDRSGNLTPGQKMNRGDFAMLVYRTLKSVQNNSEFGNATYYGGRFDGQVAASGETFNTNLPTAAHKTLPFGTIVKVTNLTNGKTVTVRINDRGPYVNGAVIDLSTTAFQEIASLSTGVVPSEVEIISQP
jgi:rare lipoprotein A (peptidoglycan hydrolase)